MHSRFLLWLRPGPQAGMASGWRDGMAAMMVHIPDLLTAEETAKCRDLLAAAQWIDGRQTAGALASRAKSNLQLGDDTLSAQLGDVILDRLGRTPRFLAAALPLKVLPPRFNRYEDSGAYGEHIDNAIFTPPGTPARIRGDLSATVFLSDPDSYDGGELVIEGAFGRQSVKLPAGHMILYPASTVHRVTPVTRGARLAAFFWVQSMVREDNRRAMLLELDDTIQALAANTPDDPALVRLTGLYHNLLREWAIT